MLRFLALALLATAVFAVEVGEKAPSLDGGKRGVNTDGNKAIAFAAHPGKPHLVDFWMTWCGPCVKSLPKVQQIHETYGPKGLVVLGVTEDTGEDITTVLAAAKTTYPVTVFEALPEAWGITAFPSVFLVDAAGKVVWQGNFLEELDPAVIASVLPKP